MHPIFCTHFARQRLFFYVSNCTPPNLLQVLLLMNTFSLFSLHDERQARAQVPG